MGYELIRHTIPEQLSIMSERYPDKKAYLFPDEQAEFTFKEIEQKAKDTARALLALGLEHGDHIGIWSYNCAKWVELLFGAAKIGIVVVPLNICFKYEELDDLCVRGDLDALFAMGEVRGQSCKNITDQFFDNGEIKKRYSRMKNIVTFSPAEDSRYMGWDTFIDGGKRITKEELTCACEKVTLDDDYLIQYTSGTTSKPKGAILYQYGVMNTAKAYTHLLHMGEKDCTCVPLPLFHCFGNILTLLGGLISASKTIYLGAFSPKRMLSVMEEEKCTCMMGVPTMYFSMLARPDFHEYDLSRLKKAGIGGSFCPQELCKRISEAFQINGLIIGYGLSEAASLCTLSDIYDEEERRIGSVGKPLPKLEVSLADPSGKEDPDIEEGEILIRGYGVMKGYYNDPEHTKEAIDEEGWLHSGDLGKRTSDGIFHVIGRVKDIIIKGGENISPGIIEEKLLKMENVRECQCVGVPDVKYGETVCAFLISKNGEPVEREEVRTYLADKISNYRIPDYVLMTDAFPLNGSGKVMKQKLTEIAIDRLHIKAGGKHE